jgi:hypothetical protein
VRLFVLYAKGSVWIRLRTNLKKGGRNGGPTVTVLYFTKTSKLRNSESCIHRVGACKFNIRQHDKFYHGAKAYNLTIILHYFLGLWRGVIDVFKCRERHVMHRIDASLQLSWLLNTYQIQGGLHFQCKITRDPTPPKYFFFIFSYAELSVDVFCPPKCCVAGFLKGQNWI